MKKIIKIIKKLIDIPTRMQVKPKSYPENSKPAFTLAEVLITLGIIGVVAAITIPNLMTAFAKHRVETQLVKFYSTMNQAIRMSVAENDTPEGWFSGNSYTYDETVEFLQTYILPYIKVSNYENCTLAFRSRHSNSVCMTNVDGTYWGFYVNGGQGLCIFYYIDGDNTNNTPKNRFNFQLALISEDSGTDINSKNFVEPFTYNWDGTTREDLKTDSGFGCNKEIANPGYCTKLIELNSWKIPGDYPW